MSHPLHPLHPCLAAAALAAALSAQTYKVQVLVTGLKAPLGIAVHKSGDLYFTQVPFPGQLNRANKVSMFDATTQRVQDLVAGEPAPTHIAVADDRSFYWTCKTAGVIMRRLGSTQTTIGRGLANPNGIAREPGGRIFFTQVPTPGTAGGRNNVAELVNGGASVLKAGEPYPADVAVAGNGDLYWTCMTAGVILKRAANGTVTKVLDFLEQPSGIAMDGAGNLYFSEVPTPGKSAAQGGRNRIWKFDPATSNLTLIHFGHPDPIDVTVSADGKAVYWTCSTAGVIARADLVAAAPAVTGNATPNLGSTVPMTAAAGSAMANRMYVAASSFGHAQYAIDTRFIALAPDFLFVATATGAGAPFFTGYVGRLDAMGRATLTVQIPTIVALRGMNLFTGFGVLSAAAPSGVEAISSTFRLQIQ